MQGAQKPTGDYLKVVWAELLTLCKIVSVMCAISWLIQARPRLELKTRPRFKMAHFVNTTMNELMVATFY
jgi:hypothetical protein